jgi:hypothetical protein
VTATTLRFRVVAASNTPPAVGNGRAPTSRVVRAVRSPVAGSSPTATVTPSRSPSCPVRGL